MIVYGNPTSIGNDITLTWQNGRQLVTYTDTAQNLSVEYKYNDGGLRTEKTVNNLKTKYFLEGSKVIYEQTGNDLIYYSYDESGNVIGINYNDTQYYFIRNGQNDIIGILDDTLTQVVEYVYDTWRRYYLNT